MGGRKNVMEGYVKCSDKRVAGVCGTGKLKETNRWDWQPKGGKNVTGSLKGTKKCDWKPI